MPLLSIQFGSAPGSLQVQEAAAGHVQPPRLIVKTRCVLVADVVAIDADANPALPSQREVYIDGGRTATGADALEWAKKIAGYGVRCILPTSKATDGVRTGFDLPLIRLIASASAAVSVAADPRPASRSPSRCRAVG